MITGLDRDLKVFAVVVVVVVLVISLFSLWIIFAAEQYFSTCFLFLLIISCSCFIRKINEELNHLKSNKKNRFYMNRCK